MDEKTIRTYDGLAKEYDAETIDFWDRFPEGVIEVFVNNVQENTKVLDIGSGPGRDGVILGSKGLDVVCVDASLAMVNMCLGRGLSAVQGDMLDLPFEKEGFGGVWAYTSLLHLKKNQIQNAIDEIKRVLVNDGVLCLGMIEGEGEGYRNSSGMNEERWFAFYTEQDLRDLLTRNGFEILYFHTFQPRSKSYLNFIARLKK